MVAAGVYNRMIMPESYGDPEGEYWRLLNGVSQWDVACERQVELKGPDAGRLAQILSSRDLSHCSNGQAKYVPLCNHRGTIINDPILLKLADDLYWLSIADSDMWTWAEAIRAERRLNVEISEPDVSPMALQGPKAEEVVANVLGDWVRGLKYFWSKQAEIDGIPILVQRSGWSKQGGFEIYLKDGSKGKELWNIFKEAGRPWDIGPGCPTTAERIESGLIDVGSDTDAQTNPFEVRLGKYVDLDVSDDVIGIQALRHIMATGIRRHQLGLILDGNEPAPRRIDRERITLNGKDVGMMTVCAWSFRMKSNVGYALVSSEVPAETIVEVMRQEGPVKAKLVELPFL
jgi:aminomethyltransferase